MMNDVLVMFLRDVLGLKAPDFSEEFSEIRARNAYDLVADVAAESVSLRKATPNTFGFFPRISLRDHADIEILRPLVAERTAELKTALLDCAGRYALGSEQLTYTELKELREEYMATARLSLALDAEHARWHKDQDEIKAATARAEEAHQSPYGNGATREQSDEALQALREKLIREYPESD